MYLMNGGFIDSPVILIPKTEIDNFIDGTDKQMEDEILIGMNEQQRKRLYEIKIIKKHIRKKEFLKCSVIKIIMITKKII